MQDAAAICALLCELENTDFSQDTFRDVLQQNLEDERIGYFIAEADKQTVGFGSIYLNKLLHHCGVVAEIQELIVASEYRNKKIGRNLVHKMIEWSEKLGALQVEVACNKSRHEAQAFYKAIGFVHSHAKLVLKDSVKYQ